MLHQFEIWTAEFCAAVTVQYAVKTSPTKNCSISTTSLPVAATVSIVIGAYVVVVVLLLAVRSILISRGACQQSCSCCGKDREPCCQCCCSCLAECCTCQSPNINACLDSVCPARQRMDFGDCVTCQCWADPNNATCCASCCSQEPLCDCGECSYSCNCQTPECNEINCCCCQITTPNHAAPPLPPPSDLYHGSYPGAGGEYGGYGPAVYRDATMNPQYPLRTYINTAGPDLGPHPGTGLGPGRGAGSVSDRAVQDDQRSRPWMTAVRHQPRLATTSSTAPAAAGASVHADR